MTLLEQTIKALLKYRKENGYSTKLKLCKCGAVATLGDYCIKCAEKIPTHWKDIDIGTGELINRTT